MIDLAWEDFDAYRKASPEEASYRYDNWLSMVAGVQASSGDFASAAKTAAQMSTVEMQYFLEDTLMPLSPDLIVLEPVRQPSATTPTYQTTYIGNTAYTTSYGGTAGYNYTESCKTTFTVVRGLIAEITYQGSACVAMEEE